MGVVRQQSVVVEELTTNLPTIAGGRGIGPQSGPAEYRELFWMCNHLQCTSGLELGTGWYDVKRNGWYVSRESGHA